MQSDTSFRRQNRVAVRAGEQLPAARPLPVQPHAKIFSPDQTPRTSAPTNSSVAFWSDDSNGAMHPNGDDFHSDSRRPESTLIYAVDDMPCLVELYALVLNAIGHRVKTFGNRHAALAALKVEPEKPALLITDFRNVSMSTDRFLYECVVAHPNLRILMATGFGHNHAWFSSVTPDRFLQKPFTPEQLQQEVRAALAGIQAGFAT